MLNRFDRSATEVDKDLHIPRWSTKTRIIFRSLLMVEDILRTTILSRILLFIIFSGPC